MEPRFFLPAEALFQGPAGLIPFIALQAAHLFRQVHADQPRPGPCRGVELGHITLAMDHHAGLGAVVAQVAGQAAGVDATDADQAVIHQPVIEMARGAEVGGLGDIGPEHQPARRRLGRFQVLRVGADVADMGKGEGDDLAGVGGVRKDFLIAGHRCIEADFADALPLGADAVPPEYCAVGENQ